MGDEGENREEEVQRPLVLLLAHDGNALSKQKTQQLMEWAQENEADAENCSFVVMQPQAHTQAQHQEPVEDGMHEDNDDVEAIVPGNNNAAEGVVRMIRQHTEDANTQPRRVLLLLGCASNVADAQALVEQGALDGVLLIITNDDGIELNSLDGPKPSFGVDRIATTSTQAQIEEDCRFIQSIPSEQLPATLDWPALVESKLKYGGDWVNFTVDEINTKGWDDGFGCMVEVAEGVFQQRVSQRLEELFEAKQAYSLWTSHASQYEVPQRRVTDGADGNQGLAGAVLPGAEDADEASTASDASLFKTYRNLVDKIPSFACTETIVVCAIVAAVTNSDELIPTRLSARAGSMSEWNSSWGVHEIPCTVENGDDVSARITRISMHVAAAARIADLTHPDGATRASALNPHNWMEFITAARAQAQSPRLVGYSGMPIYDALDEKERKLMENELMAFAKTPSEFIHRCRAIRAFDQLIAKLASYESLSARAMYCWSTRDYCFHRQLSASTFQQMMAMEMRKLPLVIREYDRLTDRLLVMLMWRPIVGRLSRSRQKIRDFVRKRTSYEEFLAYRQGNLTPRTVTAMQSIVNPDYEPSLLDKVVETVQLFPSDHSIITANGGDIDPWLTVDYASYAIGLRRPMMGADFDATDEKQTYCLTCQADDDVRFTIGLSEAGVPYVTCTDFGGEQLRFNMDGTVRMIFTSLDSDDVLLCAAAQKDRERLVAQSGEVQLFCRDGTTTHLKPTGEMVCYTPTNGSKESTEQPRKHFQTIHILRPNGVDSVWNTTSAEWSHSSSVSEVVTEKDVSSRATCQLRSNGLARVRFPDGATVSTFPDGTTIRCAPNFAEQKLVFVECRGLPSVEMNTNTTALAPRETRTCFRCVTSDGTKVQNVAQYLGVSRTERMLLIERTDGTKIEVSENGHVKLLFNLRFETWNGDGLSTQESSTRYEFDLSIGKFFVEDNECNVFEVQMADPLNPRVELAGSVEGVRAKPLISDPIPPRFFIMQRGGNAVELLRDVRVPLVENNHVANSVISPREGTAQGVEQPPKAPSTGGPVFFQAITTTRHCFQDRWPAADWQTRPIPAAARHELPEAPTVSPVSPIMYLRQVVQQLDPVSEEDVGGIYEAEKQWKRWKSAKVSHGTRVLDDQRGVEEQELSATLAKELQKLYKSLRASARREKRQAQEARMKKASDEIARDQEELESDSEMSDTSSLLDHEPVLDAEEIEILDAFTAAASEPDAQVPFDALRRALVQALGRGIARAELQTVVVGLFGSSHEHLDKLYDLEQFRSIYKLFSTSVTQELAEDSAMSGHSSYLSVQTAPAGLTTKDASGSDAQQRAQDQPAYTPGRAITHAGVPQGGWGKYDETRVPSRTAVGSGRNAVLAAGAQM